MWKLLRNLTLAALFVAGALKLLAGYAVNQDAQRVVDLLAPYAQVKYDGVSAGLNGDVTLSGVSVTPRSGHRVYRADRVALDTPGLFWMLKHALLHENMLPPHFGIDADGVSLPPENWLNPQWLNPGNFVPFLSAGCATNLGATDFRAMGIEPQATHQRLQYTWDASQHSLDVKLTLDAPGFATVGLEVQASRFEPEKFGSSAFWNTLHLEQMSASYADLGFFARRNRYCAERAKLAPAQFVERHIAAVQALLSQAHIQPGDELLRLYENLVRTGGHASVLSLPSSGFNNAQWRNDTPDVLLRQLNVTARYQDKPPIMFRLAFAPPPEVEVPLMPEMQDAATTSGAAATRPPATVPVAKPVPVAVSPVPISAAAVVPPPAIKEVQAPLVVIANPPRPEAMKIPATELDFLDRAEAKLVLPHKPLPRPEPVPAAAAPPVVTSGASAAAPPPNSTLALIWKPGVVEPLPEEAPEKLDYDVVEFSRLAELSGRHVRLMTQGRKSIEGFVVSADANNVMLRVKRGGGDAQFVLPKSRVDQVQLLHW